MKLSFTTTPLFVTLLGCSGLLSTTEGFAPSIITKTNQRYYSSLTGATFATTSSPNNNVVLRPSEDPNAFDSLKIGTARVHRYRRENDPESETEYVMWYHGRSNELDADKTLPPLSTGRIGRAKSKNGLLWKKDSKGSLSEDVKDCTLGLNNESWWGFDTAHVGLGSVLLPMTTPAIMTEGGVYLMYYMGGNFDETPIADYTERDVPADAKIKGMKLKIGVALSQDGKTWGRVEGDDPTGACIAPYDTTDPNSVRMIAEEPRGIVKEELYCGWPEVVVNIAKADDEQSGFFMYYSTMTKDDKEKSIAYASSADGFRWSKEGVCLTPGGEGSSSMDEDGVARCNVVRNAAFNDATSTWEDTDGYTMYYEGVSKTDGKHRIMMATSDDGHSWTKGGVVLDVGALDDAWDCEGVGSPNVLRMCDGSQRMYYTGQGVGGSTAIGAAKLEQDSDAWVREQATFVFAEA